MFFEGSSINLVVAFLAGIVAFFSPCVTPIVPAYVSYFAGVAARAGSEDAKKLRRRVVVNSLFFVLAFLLVFILLGLGATGLGRVFIRHRLVFQQIGGALLIVLGFVFLEVFKIPWLYRQLKIDLHGKLTRSEKLNSFLVGLTFGFAWTPCIGPVLAVILFWASQVETVGRGVGLLIAFGLGLGLPFLFVSFLLSQFTAWIRQSQRILRGLHMVAGFVIVIVGVLLITKQFDLLLKFFIGRWAPVI